MNGFSGSYAPEDVTFLLTEVEVGHTEVEAKEQFIKEGGHYSEVLSLEKAPSEEYMRIYEAVLATNRLRFAHDIRLLATEIQRSLPEGVVPVLVSLARAGTPVGVLVHRVLSQHFELPCSHYCVSIIRDRGLDLNALRYIVQKHGTAGIRFIDGWTGKGVIGAELAKSVAEFNAANETAVSGHLYVVSDIAGTAHFAATRDDYLLPSAVLNSTISGLVSRTVLSPALASSAFHGCVRYAHLAPFDVSQAFVDAIWDTLQTATPAQYPCGPEKLSANAAMCALINRYQQEYGLPHRNLVKPGIGEATRVLLRRKPLLLAVRDTENEQTRHLHFLAKTKNIPVVHDPLLPCQALALIDQLD
jgi:hypothetical protein